jgi:hypothetical protein
MKQNIQLLNFIKGIFNYESSILWTFCLDCVDFWVVMQYFGDDQISLNKWENFVLIVLCFPKRRF